MDNNDRIRKWQANRPGHSSADPLRPEDREPDDLLAELGEADTHSDSSDAAHETQSARTRRAGIDRIRAEIDMRRTEGRRDLIRKIVTFLGIPLALILGYAALFATPFYTGEAAFTVQTNSDSGGPPPTVGLIALPGSSTMITDAFKARAFILSRPMMTYMEKEYGYMSHFDDMDYLTRPGGILGTTRDPLTYYRKRVKVAIDIQDGIVRLDVDARTPEDAVRFGNAILKATERHVNEISDRIEAEQISGLTERATEAEKSLTDARIKFGRVRTQQGDISPEQSASVIYGLISSLELQLAEARGQRSALVDDGLVNSPLLPPLKAKIAELEQQIRKNRERLSSRKGGGSLAQTASVFEAATIAQDIALTRWQNSLALVQEAHLQVLNERRYVVLIVGMSSNITPKVEDWWAITKPILILLLIVGAIVYTLRRSGRLPDGLDHPKLRELVNRWK